MLAVLMCNVPHRFLLIIFSWSNKTRDSWEFIKYIIFSCGYVTIENIIVENECIKLVKKPVIRGHLLYVLFVLDVLLASNSGCE